MKSLHTTRRPSFTLLVSIGLAITAAIVIIGFSFQTRNEPVNNVSQIFMTDPITTRPSVTRTVIESPIASLQTPPVQVTADNVGTAVKQTAAAQSRSVGSIVDYPTLQISASQRDRLFVVAFSISIIGVSLYLMTLLSVAPQPLPVTRRPFYKVMDM